jgi:GAF domain-containing protein
LNKTIRVLLMDCDTDFGQRLPVALAAEGIHVDSAANPVELFERLRASTGKYELVLLGRHEQPERETEILEDIRKKDPTLGIITLTDPVAAWQSHWISDTMIYCSADRKADGRLLAHTIKSAVSHRFAQQQSQNLQALISAAERVGGAKTEEQLYQQLYEAASELLPGLDGFLIAHYDEQTNEVSFPFSYKHHKRIHIRSRRGGRSIAEYVFLTKEPLLLTYGDELFRLQHGLNPPDDNLGYCNSEIIVPMFVEGRKIHGAVFVSSDDPQLHYTAEHLQILTTFTNQAGLTIQTFIQLKEANQLRDATAALAGQHGREGILRAIVEGAHKIVASDFTGLILLDEKGELHKVRPVIPENFFEKFSEARKESGVTRAVIESRKPMNIPDTSKNRLVKDSVREAGIKSMLVLPLIHRDRVLGVLYTHTFKFRDFVARDIALWSAFATQAASALDRVFEEERQIRDYQRLISELGSLEENLSLKQTLIRVATVAKSVFNSDTCRLFYIDPITGKVVDSAWAEGDAMEYHVEIMPRPSGSTHYVLRTKKPFYYPDMKEGPSQRAELLTAGLRSSVSLPLRYGTRDIGVLHCNYFTRRVTFDEHYQALMEAFGARAAVAMNRAAAKHKADIWRGLDREIVNCTDIRELYKLFTLKANEALGADFSLFYPYDPTSSDAGRLPIKNQVVLAGTLRKPLRASRGGRGGGVFKEIAHRRSIMIVKELDPHAEKFSSHLTRREGVRSFVAMRLEVIPQETLEPNLAGILFVNYRQVTSLTDGDLRELRSASGLIAAGILRLSLEAELQQAFKKCNEQLRAVIQIFQTHESKRLDQNLNHIARHATLSLGLDTCTILEFHPALGRFAGRGNYGLLHPAYEKVTVGSRFEDEYMYKDHPTVIADVRTDPFMKRSKFARREGIRSTVVCPLRVDGESLGLLFANFRHPMKPSAEELKTYVLFADVAAHVLHRARLQSLFNESQQKEERNRLLVWVSLVHDMWQHTLVQKAAAIRNYAQTLLKWMNTYPRLPEVAPNFRHWLQEIDGLAEDIANAPPRVPHDREMKKEAIPIGPFLKEIAERERRRLQLEGETRHHIDVHLKNLGGIQVYGYLRWLIYIFESLFMNSRAAMAARAGQITISACRQRQWVEIRIQDTGKGVPKRLRDKLFKVQITGKRPHAGLGIGSLLVTTLVEENQGTIELEKPGPGDTTVLIRLPIYRQAKKA